MALEKYKILSSVYALDSFTADELAARSGVNKNTVRAWLSGEKEWVEEIDIVSPTCRPGRPTKTWRLRPGKVQELFELLRDLWCRVSEAVGKDAQLKNVGPRFDDFTAFETAEAYLDTAARESSDDLIVEMTDLAKAWVSSRVEALQEWAAAGYTIPDEIWIRVERIYLRADRTAWNIDKFVYSILDKGVVEVHKEILAALDHLASLDDNHSFVGALAPIRWRRDVPFDKQFRHVFTLLYGDVEHKVTCALLISLAQLRSGQNYIRTILIAVLDQLGPERVAACLEGWTSASVEPRWTTRELEWVVTGVMAHRGFVAHKLIGDWAGRLSVLPGLSSALRLSLECIVECSSKGAMRPSLPDYVRKRRNDLQELFAKDNQEEDGSNDPAALRPLPFVREFGRKALNLVYLEQGTVDLEQGTVDLEPGTLDTNAHQPPQKDWEVFLRRMRRMQRYLTGAGLVERQGVSLQ